MGVQRRRPGARLRGRRRAHRHGVRPVPPDRHGLAARRPRPAGHRGGPRRGRHPAQQGRRAVHVEVPARGAAGRVRRDRRGGRALGDRPVRRAARPTPGGRPSCRPATTSRGPSTPRSRRAAGRRTAASSSTSATCRADHVRRKLPSMYEQFKELADVDITAGPMEVGPTTHYVMGGIRVDAETGATTVAGPVRRGRGRRRHARRQPARRQLALGPARVRGADRGGGGRARRRPGRRRRTSTRSRSGRPTRDLAAPLERTDGEDPYAIQRDLQEMMQRLVGIFRVEADLDEALDRSWPSCARALDERPGRPAAAPTTRAGTSSSSCATC